MKNNSKCAICKTLTALEEHHIIPRCYGGEDGPTADICGSCHALIHKAAQARLSGKSSYDIVPMHLADKLEPYVKAIVVSAIKSQSRRDNLNGKLIISLPNNMLQALHILKKDKGFSNIETYILHLLSIELHNHGIEINKKVNHV